MWLMFFLRRDQAVGGSAVIAAWHYAPDASLKSAKTHLSLSNETSAFGADLVLSP